MKVNLVPILETVKEFFPDSENGGTKESGVVHINQKKINKPDKKITVANLYYDWHKHALILKQTGQLSGSEEYKRVIYDKLREASLRVEKRHILPKWRRALRRMNPLIDNALEYTDLILWE